MIWYLVIELKISNIWCNYFCVYLFHIMKIECKFQNCNFQNRNKLLFASVSISVAWFVTLQNSTDYLMPLQGYNVKKQTFGQKDNFPFLHHANLSCKRYILIYRKNIVLYKGYKNYKLYCKIISYVHQHFWHIQMCISFAQ